jgi:Fe-S cluster assembly iron-binding protein IscA
MITVTERAAARLEDMLKVNNAAPGEGVKLVPGGTDVIDMTIDTPSAGDEVIPTGAAATLIVDSRIVGALDGVLDCGIQVVEGEPRAKLEFVPAEER